MPPDLLRSLVREVVEEVLHEALSAGLAGGSATRTSPIDPHRPPEPRAPRRTRRVERGAVTERVVREAARDGVALVLGSRAVLTPLGRDLSRTLGVDVERRTDSEET